MNIARLLVLGLLAAVVVGCASSSGSVSGADDPAAVVPASAPLYAEATVRPQGQGRADAQAVLGKVLGTGDPGAKLEARFDHAARAYGVTFKDDVEPWLGDRIAAAVTSPRSGRGDAILVLTCTDDAKAQAAIDKLRGDFVGRSYQGVAYRYDRKDANAAALVDHNIVIGTEAGVKSAIDASKGTSLAQSSGLRDARAKVAQDRIALLYADVQGAVLAATRGGDPQLAIAAQALALALPRTLAAAVVPDGDVVRLDAVSLGTPTQLSTGRSGADI